QMVLMLTLHDDNDRAILFVVEARDQGAGVPFDQALARRFRRRILGFLRIVEDNEVAAASGEGAANRSGVPAAPGRGDEFGAGISGGSYSWKQSLIPGGIDHHAELAMQFSGQLV